MNDSNTGGNAILTHALQGDDPIDLNALASEGVIRIRVTELETRCLVQSIAFSDDKNVVFAVTGGDIARLQNGKRYVVVVYDVLLEAEDTQL